MTAQAERAQSATGRRHPAASAVSRARGRRGLVIGGLVVSLLAVVLLSAAVGQFSLSPADILASIGRRLVVGAAVRAAQRAALPRIRRTSGTW